MRFVETRQRNWVKPIISIYFNQIPSIFETRKYTIELDKMIYTTLMGLVIQLSICKLDYVYYRVDFGISHPEIR